MCYIYLERFFYESCKFDHISIILCRMNLFTACLSEKIQLILQLCRAGIWLVHTNVLCYSNWIIFWFWNGRSLRLIWTILNLKNAKLCCLLPWNWTSNLLFYLSIILIRTSWSLDLLKHYQWRVKSIFTQFSNCFSPPMTINNA